MKGFHSLIEKAGPCLWAFLFLILTTPGQVDAEDFISKMTIGPWHGGSVDNTGNRKADYCQLAATSSKGFSILMIWVEPGLLLGIVDDKLNLSKKSYPAQIAIDPLYKGEAILEASGSSTLALHIFKNQTIINAIQKGTSMHIAAPGTGDWSTPLTGTLKAIEALKNCYRTQIEGKPDNKSPIKQVPISLISKKTVFKTGEHIQVSFSNLPAKGQDWLAISASTHKPDQYYDMVMLEGHPKSGTHTFKALPAGDYEIRVYTDWPDKGYIVAKKLPVSIINPEPQTVPTTIPAILPGSNPPSESPPDSGTSLLSESSGSTQSLPPIEANLPQALSPLQMAYLLDRLEQEIPPESERSQTFNQTFNQAFELLTPKSAIELARACHTQALKYTLVTAESDNTYALSFALVYATTAVALDPAGLDYLMLLAQIQSAQVQNMTALFEAELTLKTLLGIAPAHGRARLALTRVMLLQGEPIEAMEAMEPLLLNGDPLVSDPAVLALSLRVYELADALPRGIQTFESLGQHHPRLEPAKVVLAMLLHASDQTSKALEILESILASTSEQLRLLAEQLIKEWQS